MDAQEKQCAVFLNDPPNAVLQQISHIWSNKITHVDEVTV